MLHGLFELPFCGYLVTILALTHISLVSASIFLHRHQAHRALKLHPIASHFFRFWLWLTSGMRTREWVAVHRKHHAHCETEADPHSPQLLGINKVLWGGAVLYRRAASDAATIKRYGKGTPNDWVERHVYEPMSHLGLALMLLIDLVLFGLSGVVIWVTQMLWVPFWAAGVLNGIGHYCGYRSYDCGNAARNIVPWGILLAGEELHNNHHAFPTSPKLSAQWWELDISWLYIRLLERLKLARPNRAVQPHRTGVFSRHNPD